MKNIINKKLKIDLKLLSKTILNVIKKGTMQVKNIKIVVATHKKYKMPDDKMYIPVQVGSEGKEDIGFQKDNYGENISSKNAYFCELTGLYWAWKNLEYDYMGLSHYRRHFSVSKKLPKDIEGRVNSAIKYEDVDEILNNTDIILPKKRKYYIENLYSHYEHTMHIEPLNETKKIIREKCPEYLEEFEKLHKRTSAHMFNMFIMKKEILNDYCTWLFDILFELEKRIPPEQYDKFHARYLGRISELLLDVWINTNSLKYEEVQVIDIEKIDWIKKGYSFIKAKFFGGKYGKSF